MGPDVEVYDTCTGSCHHRSQRKVKYRHKMTIEQVREQIPDGWMVVPKKKYDEDMQLLERLKE